MLKQTCEFSLVLGLGLMLNGTRLIKIDMTPYLKDNVSYRVLYDVREMLKRTHEFAFWTRFHVFAGACVFNMDVLVSKHNLSYQVLHPIREMVKQTYQFAFSPCMGLISFFLLAPVCSRWIQTTCFK